jgi:DNA-binding transcriptional MerR regulator
MTPPSNSPPESPATERERYEYSVDELARTADTTVRNVRAYQDRGLLPPPERRGRAGIYTEAHLARLRLINQLLKRGYTLGNIAELITAWERGQDLRELLGLESALTMPWSEELPAYFTMAELLRMFGKDLPVTTVTDVIRKAVELEVLQVDGLRFRAPRPQLIHAGEQLVAMGIPLVELLDIVRMLRGNVERVANELVQLVVKYVFDPYMKGQLPPASEVPRLADTVWRLRPIADMAVNAEVARAMEGAVNKYLGEVMTHIMEQLPKR